jgi:hypothetical protein
MAANRVVGCEHPQPITPSPRVALKRKFPGDYGLPVQLRTAAALNTAQNLAANRSQPVGWASYAKATPVQDVRIDHRRAYIGMPQQLLHRADVIPALQQVCGERMPEDMTAHPLRHACPTRSLRDGSLHDGLVQVIPRRWAESRIAADTPGRKHELPSPLGRRVWVLPTERVGHHDSPESRCEIPMMQSLHVSKVLCQRLLNPVWQHRPPIPLAFASSHNDFAAVEIDVFYAQFETLLEPEPGSI